MKKDKVRFKIGYPPRNKEDNLDLRMVGRSNKSNV